MSLFIGFSFFLFWPLQLLTLTLTDAKLEAFLLEQPLRALLINHKPFVLVHAVQLSQPGP